MWKNLIQALKDLSDAYAALLEIAGRKRAVLVAVDLKGLEPIVAEEEQQLERIRAAEKRRQDALLALSKEIPSIHPEMAMTEVEAACPGDLRTALRAVHSQLGKRVEKAKESLRAGQKTILFIDEIHRYSKTQQDALLPHLENGTLFLIGSTTENPSFQVVPALLSRVQVVRLNSIDDDSMASIIKRGFQYLATHYSQMDCESGVLDFIISLARGDARYALNIVENAYFASDLKDNKRYLTVKIIEEICQQHNTMYSEQEHYDCASAFQKSLRGSDPDAAIYYLAKMLKSGEDPRFIARRLIVCAAEDVGLADPRAVQIAVNAYKAVELIGLPEGRIPLAQAVIYVARAPKSNEAACAIDEALSDISNGKDFPPPMHLRDSHYKDAAKYGFGVGYVYTHSAPDVDQQFMPDELVDRKYTRE